MEEKTKNLQQIFHFLIFFNNWAAQYINNFVEKINSGKDTSPPNLLKLLYDPAKGQDETYNKQ